MKTFFIRADASSEIGSGHVSRCLALAHSLRALGNRVTFICRDLPGHAIPLVEAQGFRCLRLPARAGDAAEPGRGPGWREDAILTLEALEHPVDWVIVDHYALDARWQRLIRPRARALMAIDDLADRPHEVDVLLDQNLHHGLETRYRGLVPAPCRLLLGPRYALLRPEFSEGTRRQRRRDGHIRRLLVTFGGSDESNETGKALAALALLPPSGLEVDVVVGASCPWRAEIEARCRSLAGFRFHCQTRRMAELMGEADLCIGAGGSTTWERCFLGLPAITLTLGENQASVNRAVHEAGAAWNLGDAETTDAGMIASALQALLHEPARVQAMSERARRLMGDDGGGEGAAVVAALLAQLPLSAPPAHPRLEAP